MTITDDTAALHGLTTGSGGEGCVGIYYDYPGTIDVQVATGIKWHSRDRKKVLLGHFCDPEEDFSAALVAGLWKWEPGTNSKTQEWVKHVFAAYSEERSHSYEHQRELVVIAHRIPTRVIEADLWGMGFRPSLATWRAPSTPTRRELVPGVLEALNRKNAVVGDIAEIEATDKDRDTAQHAWMRWYSLFGKEFGVGRRTYKLRGHPKLADGELVISFHHQSSGRDLTFFIDVASHPLFHDVFVEAEDRELEPGTFAWEDLPSLPAQIEEAIAPKTGGRRVGKTRGRLAATTSRPAEPQAATPSQSTITWAQAVADAFEQTPGYRLEISVRGQQGHVVAVYPEGGDLKDVVVSIDLEAGDIEEVRWLSGRLTRAEQDEILDRLGAALKAASKVEKGEPVSPIDELIAMMEHRGRILGADPAQRAKDPQSLLARTFAELAEPSPSTPAELMQWLERADFSAAADLVSKFRSGDVPGDLAVLGRELWRAAVGSLSVGGVRREGALWRVPCESLYTDRSNGLVRLLARRLLANGEYFLLPTVVRSVQSKPEGGITVCEIDDENDRLLPTDMVYILEREPAEYIELHARIKQFLVEVERTPERLQDVRRLLYWTAAMIETPRCQGWYRMAARRALEQAVLHYDDARVQLARGSSVAAFQRVHDVLRRLSAAVARMAEACAEGQLPLQGLGARPSSLEPSAADTAVLGELARSTPKLRIGELKEVPEPRSATGRGGQDAGGRTNRADELSDGPGHEPRAQQNAASVPITLPTGLVAARAALARAGLSPEQISVRALGRLGECRARDPRTREHARRVLHDVGIVASVVRDRLVFPLGVS